MGGAKRIRSLDELVKLTGALRGAGKRIALTNGCYEILHVGHLRSLQGARREADCLIVAVNSDASVARWKGRRPVVPEAERAELVAALDCVDHVYVFDEPSVDALLEAIRPDAYCKGPEYTLDNLPERETLARIGGRLVAVGGPKDHSTTELIRRIVELHGEPQTGVPR